MNNIKAPLVQSILLLLSLGLAGCGGAKVLRQPEPLTLSQPLATASDQHLQASLDWVIFRGGPGTWAKNVDWDEYLMRVQNLSEETIEITSITVVDAMETRIEPRGNRRDLVKGTKEAKRRYKGEGLKVKAGASGTVIAGSGLLLASGTSGLGAAAMYGGAAGAGLAVGVVLLVPTLAIGGVVRGVNNSKVNNQIEARQTLLPVALEGKEEKTLDIFYPLSPSPKFVEIGFSDAQGNHTLIVDTQTALDGLHLLKTEE